MLVIQNNAKHLRNTALAQWEKSQTANLTGMLATDPNEPHSGLNREYHVRIALFYNRDIYAHKALNLLIPRLSDHSLSFFYSNYVGGNIVRDVRLQKLAEFEKRFTTRPGWSFEELAQSARTVEHGVSDINGSDAAKLSDFKPDLVISIRFGQIFKAPAISTPRLGIINLHSGLLPAYKGVMASFWSLLNGESHLGTTLHWVTDSKIDSGQVISLCRQTVQIDLTYSEQVLALYEPGVAQILEAVAQIETLAKESKKDLPKGNYYSFPEAAHLDAFDKAGWTLF